MDRELAGFLIVVGLLLVLTAVIVVGCAGTYEYQVCKARSELNSEYQYKWVLWGGCLVKLPSGMWVGYKDARFVELETGR